MDNTQNENTENVENTENTENNKLNWKKIGLLLFILAVIIALLLLEPSDDSSEETASGLSEPEQVQNACEDFLSAYCQNDASAVTELLADASYGSEINLSGYPEISGKEMTWQLGEVTKAEEAESDQPRYYVQAEITSLDFPTLAGDESFLTRTAQSDVLTALQEVIAEGSAPEKTYEVQIQLIRENENWKVRMDNSLSDALLGGYVTFYQEMTDEFMEVPANENENN